MTPASTDEGNPTGRLRIAMVSYYLPSESKMGVGYQAHALANQLARRGHDVTMYSSCRPTGGARYRTTTLKPHGSIRTFRFANRLRGIDWSAFDVLHAHNGDFLIARSTCAHIRTVHGSSLREAVHIGGVRPRAAMLYYAAGECLATALADRTVAVSRTTQRWLPWIKCQIPNGVDLNAFHSGAKSAKPSILFVGTYERRKRGRLLAEVFQTSVRSRVAEAELWMVADDAPRHLPGIRVFGRLSDHELQALYRSAWVFCLPSTYEGFGIPYIEAMASGTAVVASRNAGALEIIEDGRHGVLTDDEGLGKALVRLLTQQDEREKLATNAALAVRRFDLAEVAKRYELLYRDAIALKAGRAAGS